MKKSLLALLCLSVVTAFVTAACGGSGSSSSSSSAADSTSTSSSAGTSEETPPSKSPSGEPIKVGIIATIGTATHNTPDYVTALTAGAEATNEAGGIDGQPVEIVVCDDDADPNKARACANEMVSDHVASTVSDLSEGDPITVAQILNEGGIPQFALLANNVIEFNLPTTFPFSGGSAYNWAATMVPAKEAGCKSMALVFIQNPIWDGLKPTVVAAAKHEGIAIKDIELLPPEGAEYAANVANIQSSGAECMSWGMGEPFTQKLFSAMEQLGYQPKFLSTLVGTLTAESLKELGGQLEGLVQGSAIPPPSARQQFPIYDEAEEEIENAAEKDSSLVHSNEFSLLGFQAWFAFKAWIQIAEEAGANGPITNTSMLKGIESAKDIELGGAIPPWSPGDFNAGSGELRRVSNPAVWLLNTKEGETVLPEGAEPFDASTILPPPDPASGN